MKIFVGNMSPDTSNDDLKKAAEAIGEVVSVSINRDEAGESRGFGFVEAADKPTAEKIIAGLDKKKLKGSVLRANEARPKKPVRGGKGPQTWKGLGGKQSMGQSAGKRVKKGNGAAGYNGGRVGSGEG